VIESFGDQETCDLFVDGDVPAKGCGWKNVASVAERKLELINGAEQVEDLRQPPGNRLEKLAGKDDWYSIRIHDQWRIHFRWAAGDDVPEFVHIIDHHD